MGVFLLVSTPLAAGKVLIANVILLFQATGNVRIGSLADHFSNISLMSAFPVSGRSGTAKTAQIKVRFRPQAASAAIYQILI